MSRFSAKRAAVLLGAVVGLLTAGAVVRAADAAKPAPEKEAALAKSQAIDLVLCLDVSNSMDGLIDSAKIKLWDIVNDLAKIRPTPELRVGLYSYGNDGYDARIGWVRKEVDLTTDLDEIYQKLNALTTNGGTEFVARVTRDAIKQQKWSPSKDALRIVFVCGNEPASQDKEVALQTVADKAVAHDVVINCIYCGGANDPDAADWKEYAKMAKGKFLHIDQQGTVTVATPFDKELNKLSGKLNTTYLACGVRSVVEAQQANQTVQDANAVRNAPEAGAARAASKASGVYRNDAWDLIDKAKNDPKFCLKDVPTEHLPDEMQKMTLEEKEAYIQKKAAERVEMQKKIQELSAQRQEYIKEAMKKIDPTKAEKAFDAAVRGVLKEQANAKGMKIAE
jgi:hypothetical protein